jgi:hypothetical protein
MWQHLNGIYAAIISMEYHLFDILMMIGRKESENDDNKIFMIEQHATYPNQQDLR